MIIERYERTKYALSRMGSSWAPRGGQLWKHRCGGRSQASPGIGRSEDRLQFLCPLLLNNEAWVETGLDTLDEVGPS